MRKLTLLFSLLIIIAGLLLPAALLAQSGEPLAPRLEGMGEHHHEIDTDNPEAQLFFDQGLVLAFAFNHAEAHRSFSEAARLDPACAMCYWGQALVLGPNINAPMNPDDVATAYEASRRALQLVDPASARERAYVEALAARYEKSPPEDRRELDHAYAREMEALARRFPADVDALALYAEALMDTMPWDYWTAEGQPKDATKRLLATLEETLELAPNHPLANHLYIHAVEKVHPERGIEAAERLGNLVPGAGHLVHMPGHIWIRVGRYHDAVLANQRAIEADEQYLATCHAQGLYPIGYVPHNHHFLWYGAMMAGMREAALEAAANVAGSVDQELMREPGYGTLQHFSMIPLYTYVHFRAWDEALAAPEPASDLTYPRGVWHFARGMALARKGDLAQAAAELAELRSIASDPELEQVTIWEINTTQALLGVAEEMLAGELAAERGQWKEAARHMREAVRREEALNYDEPPSWALASRHALGAVLLKAGEPAEAERAYRADLAVYPENGQALVGLQEALRRQGQTQQADLLQVRIEAAQKYADAPFTVSGR